MKHSYLVVFTCCTLLSIESGTATEQGAEHKYFVKPYSLEQQEKILQNLPASSVEKFLGEPDKTSDLRNFSITMDKTGKYVLSARRHPIDRRGSNTTNTSEYYPLSRPGESNIVGVIKAYSKYQNVLNPVHGFNYGPIPPLTQMTESTADTLWGKAMSESDVAVQGRNFKEKNYRLKSTNKDGATKEYVLKCHFQQGKLASYKIKGPGADGILPYDVIDDLFFKD